MAAAATARIDGDVLTVSAEADAVPRAIWEAVGEERHVRAWWFGGFVRDCGPHGRLEERWVRGGLAVLTSARFPEVDPPAMRLVFTRRDYDWAFATRVSPVVAFRRAPIDASARIVLTHDGWEGASADRRADLLADHAEGWSRHLNDACRHAERRA